MKRFLLFSYVLFHCSLAYSQLSATHSKPLSLFSNNYIIDFEYIINSGDTLFNGDYHLYNSVENKLLDDTFKYVNIKGTYDKHIPTGFWSVVSGQAEVNSEAFFNNYLLSRRISGNEINYSGSLKNSKKKGDWQLFNWVYDHSSNLDTLLSTVIPFQEDKVNGSINIRDRNYVIEGEVNPSGYAEGVWSVYKNSERGEKIRIEEWVFENRQLKTKVNFQTDQKVSFNLDLQEEQETKIEDIEFSKEYLRIIELISDNKTNQDSQKVDEFKSLYSKFQESILKLNSIDSITKLENDLTFRPVIYVQLESILLQKKEHLFFKNFQNQIALKDSLIHLYAENNETGLEVIQSYKVKAKLSIIKAIQKQIGVPLDTLLNLYNGNILKYLNRARYIEQNIHFNSQVVLDSIDGVLVDSIYIFKKEFTDNFNNTYDKLGNYMIYLTNEIKSVNDSLEYYLFEVKKEKNILQQEVELLNRSKELKYLNDSLVSYFQNELAGFDLTASIVTFIDSELNDYTNISNFDEKAAKLTQLLNCFSDLEQLIYTLEQVPNLYFKLKDNYTKVVFNPYTFTNMEEINKSSIYKSFNKVILPALFKNIEGMECANVENYKNNFGIAFQGMIDLLGKDTNKEERKIKRVKDPKDAAAIINLQLIFK